MGSSRLPGKIKKLLNGKPVLQHIMERCQMVRGVDQVIVATTSGPDDDEVEELCKVSEIPVFRGSSENVLERYYEAARRFGIGLVVRVTGDCPLIDPDIIDSCVSRFASADVDYLSNVSPGKSEFPEGLAVEVFSFDALERAYRNATENYEKEHVTPHIWENRRNQFKIAPILPAPSEYRYHHRLTLDYPQDLVLLERVFREFAILGRPLRVPLVLEYLEQHPEIASINACCEQKPVTSADSKWQR